jgi:aminoglycoside phosphotransferase (APT) family kinase protein
MDAFLGQLARTMTAIHAASEHLRGRVPGYRSYYYDQRSPAASRWSRRPRLWERALELARADPPPGPRCFIHRDYHPENTLWSRGRLTGVVDWASAAWGPGGIPRRWLEPLAQPDRLVPAATALASHAAISAK